MAAAGSSRFHIFFLHVLNLPFFPHVLYLVNLRFFFSHVLTFFLLVFSLFSPSSLGYLLFCFLFVFSECFQFCFVSVAYIM